jgi:hypothetical protein
MWVSDYSWGWAPFHYGRWMHDPYYGWVWVPGYEWSPAWVAWRHGGDYYGWAPLRPGFNISIGFGSYNPPNNYWCFTPRRYISSPRIYNHYIDRSRNITIINNTTIINNNYGRRSNNVFVNGPRRQDAERYTGRINPVRFRESNAPGRTRVRNNEVSVFRPRVDRDDDRRITPRNVERYERNGQQNGTVRNNEGRSGNVLNRPNNQVRERENNNNRNSNVFDRNRQNTERDAEIRRQQTENNAGNNNRNNRNERNVFERRQREQTPQTQQPNRPQERRNAEPRVRPQQESRPQQERNVFERRTQERNTEARGNRPAQQRVERPSQPRQEQRVERQSQPRQEQRVERQSQPRQIDRGNSGGGQNRGGGKKVFDR